MRLRKLSIISSIIIIISLCTYTPCTASANPVIDAEAAVLIDIETGQLLFSKNPEKKLFPASTTKIMTAILALENGNTGQIMTASKKAVYDIGPDGMHVGIKPGDKYKLDVLLNVLLVRSANESANVIAENICPTRSDFINLMNKRAGELGCTKTNFTNTNGMHNSNHYTTALDLSKMARHAMSIPYFREIVSKKFYNMPRAENPDKTVYLQSTNKLLSESSECFNKITGIKTGYTSQAGYNIVSSSINSNGIELIAVILNAGSRDKSFLYAKRLLEYGYSNYKVQEVVHTHEIIESININDSNNKSQLNLIAAKGLHCLLPEDKSDWNIKKTKVIDNPIKAPVKKGDVLGYVLFKRNGTTLGKIDLEASMSIDKSLSSNIKDVANNTKSGNNLPYIILGGITALIIFFIIRGFKKKSAQKKYS